MAGQFWDHGLFGSQFLTTGVLTHLEAILLAKYRQGNSIRLRQITGVVGVQVVAAVITA